MRTFLLTMLMTFPAFACRLEWKSGDKETSCIEMVELKNGCAFPEEKENCFVLRHCGTSGKDWGATQFRESVDPSSYCLEGKDQDAFSPSRKSDPRAFVECQGVQKPRGIRLESADKKHSKLCPFPYAK